MHPEQMDIQAPAKTPHRPRCVACAKRRAKYSCGAALVCSWECAVAHHYRSAATPPPRASLASGWVRTADADQISSMREEDFANMPPVSDAMYELVAAIVSLENSNYIWKHGMVSVGGIDHGGDLDELWASQSKNPAANGASHVRFLADFLVAYLIGTNGIKDPNPTPNLTTQFLGLEVFGILTYKIYHSYLQEMVPVIIDRVLYNATVAGTTIVKSGPWKEWRVLRTASGTYTLGATSTDLYASFAAYMSNIPVSELSVIRSVNAARYVKWARRQDFGALLFNAGLIPYIPSDAWVSDDKRNIVDLVRKWKDLMVTILDTLPVKDEPYVQADVLTLLYAKKKIPKESSMLAPAIAGVVDRMFGELIAWISANPPTPDVDRGQILTMEGVKDT